MISLYKGDNGVQDFWESSDNRILLLRVKGQKIWQFFSYGGLYFKKGYGILDPNSNLMDNSLLKLVVQVEKELDISLFFDGSKEFVSWRGKRSEHKMRLRSLIC